MTSKFPETLTPEQSFILNIPCDESCIVEGGAGTGKTVMAIFRAKQIADKIRENKKPGRVLILVYNKPLCKYLETEIQISGYANLITVMTLWGFLYRLWGTFDRIPPAETPKVNPIFDTCEREKS